MSLSTTITTVLFVYQHTNTPWQAVDEVQQSTVAFTFCELFAGIGGFGVGLESLKSQGWDGTSVLASEINASARCLYALNFGGPEETIAGNILHIASEAVPSHDLLTAGFPCQPFTEKGPEKQEKGFRDARGQLFWHVIRLVKTSQPKAVLLENVPGLLKNDMRRDTSARGVHQEGVEGSAIDAVLSALSMCGYSVSWRIYDAQEWVPQCRLRLFIVAIRQDLVDKRRPGFRWPQEPSGRRPQINDILQHSSEVDLEPYRLRPREWKEVSASAYFQQHPEHRLPPLDSCTNTLRSSYRSGFKLYSQFVPLENATIADASSERDSPRFRFFTPRECARLQGFPDTFTLTNGAVPESAQYHAVGNAVVPPVVAAIARAVLAVVL